MMTLTEYIENKLDEILNEMVETVPEFKEEIKQSKDTIEFIALKASEWTINFMKESLNERRTNTSVEETKMDESD